VANILLSHAAFALDDYQDISDFLSELNSTVETARKDGDRIYGNYNIGELNTGVGFTLNELVWKPLPEIKAAIPAFTKDSQKIIYMLLSFSESPNSSFTSEAMNDEFAEAHNGLMGFAFNPSTNPDYEIINEKTWFNFHRQYFVEHIPSRQDFVESVKSYFPNLHFSSSIASGLSNFQGTTYPDIVKTIIYHLTALNDDFIDLFKVHHAEGADSVCDMLEAKFSPLDNSLGASRDANGIVELLFNFTDDNGIKRDFDCNLHTKFESYFELQNPNHTLKSNRIYFHQPTNDFMKGKVLVGRIGRHRDIGFH
jgi:hypothetical protein